MKIYFVAGENESASMVPDMFRMKNLLTDKGFESNEIKYVTLPDDTMKLYGHTPIRLLMFGSFLTHGLPIIFKKK